MGGTDADGAAQAGASGAPDSQPAPGAGMNALEAGAVAPAKKDTSLREFLGQMDDYAPIVSSAPVCLVCLHFDIRRLLCKCAEDMKLISSSYARSLTP